MGAAVFQMAQGGELEAIFGFIYLDFGARVVAKQFGHRDFRVCGLVAKLFAVAVLRVLISAESDAGTTRVPDQCPTSRACNQLHSQSPLNAKT